MRHGIIVIDRCDGGLAVVPVLRRLLELLKRREMIMFVGFGARNTRIACGGYHRHGAESKGYWNGTRFSPMIAQIGRRMRRLEIEWYHLPIADEMIGG